MIPWVLFLQIVLLAIVLYLVLYALIEQWHKMKTTHQVAVAQLKKDNHLN